MSHANALRAVLWLTVLLFFQMNPHPAMASLNLPQSLDKAVLEVTAWVFDMRDEATQAQWEKTMRSLAQLERTAGENLANLDIISAKPTKDDDQLETHHKERLQTIADDTYQRVTSALRKADQDVQERLKEIRAIFDAAAKELRKQQVVLFIDFDHLLDDVECLGRDMKWTFEKVFEDVEKGVPQPPNWLKVAVLETTHKNVPILSTKQSYNLIKQFLLNTLDENDLVEHVVKTYAVLESTVKRVGCAHGKYLDRAILVEDLLMYARKIRLWRSICGVLRCQGTN